MADEPNPPGAEQGRSNPGPVNNSQLMRLKPPPHHPNVPRPNGGGGGGWTSPSYGGKPRSRGPRRGRGR